MKGHCIVVVGRALGSNTRNGAVGVALILAAASCNELLATAAHAPHTLLARRLAAAAAWPSAASRADEGIDEAPLLDTDMLEGHVPIERALRLLPRTLALVGRPFERAEAAGGGRWWRSGCCCATDEARPSTSRGPRCSTSILSSSSSRPEEACNAASIASTSRAVCGRDAASLEAHREASLEAHRETARGGSLVEGGWGGMGWGMDRRV